MYWEYTCIGCGKFTRETAPGRGGGGRKIGVAYCRPCVRAIVEGTEVLPVIQVRECEYPDGCDQVPMPGSTCCWQHRRYGKLFPRVEQPAPLRERNNDRSETERPPDVSGLAVAETPARDRVMVGSAATRAARRAPGHTDRPASEGAVSERKCKCNCGQTVSGKRDYVWGHKTKKSQTRSIQVSETARDALRAMDTDVHAEPTFTVTLTVMVMDALWGMMDGERKAALLSKMGAE